MRVLRQTRGLLGSCTLFSFINGPSPSGGGGAAAEQKRARAVAAPHETGVACILLFVRFRRLIFSRFPARVVRTAIALETTTVSVGTGKKMQNKRFSTARGPSIGRVYLVGSLFHVIATFFFSPRRTIQKRLLSKKKSFKTEHPVCCDPFEVKGKSHDTATYFIARNGNQFNL